MCLDKLSNRPTIPKKGICYKVFIYDDDETVFNTPYKTGTYRLYTPYINPLPLVTLETNDNVTYGAGFHAFLTEQDAREYMEGLYDYQSTKWTSFRIIKCTYDNLTNVGHQDDLLIIVFQNLTLVEVL